MEEKATDDATTSEMHVVHTILPLHAKRVQSWKWKMMCKNKR